MDTPFSTGVSSAFEVRRVAQRLHERTPTVAPTTAALGRMRRWMRTRVQLRSATRHKLATTLLHLLILQPSIRTHAAALSSWSDRIQAVGPRSRVKQLPDCARLRSDLGAHHTPGRSILFSSRRAAAVRAVRPLGDTSTSSLRSLLG
jgi:hypothetical protein